MLDEQDLGTEAKERGQLTTKLKAARDIVETIEKWTVSKQYTAERRWIFELVQNAIDVARKRGQKALLLEFDFDGSRFVFRHNAGYFEVDELDALIYGGSSKPYEAESDYLGRFGNGFLVSHIVARKVVLNAAIRRRTGKIEARELTIDRTGLTIEAIAGAIDDVLDHQLKESSPPAELKEYWTEYIYSDVNELGQRAVREGFDQLKKNMVPILAFNAIEQVTVDREPFKKIPGLIGEITTTRVGTDSICCLESKKTPGLSVGILLKGAAVCDLKGRPAVFIGVPIMETSDYLAVPFIFNYTKFETNPDRDSLADSERNNGLLPEVFGLHRELLNQLLQNAVDVGINLETSHRLIAFDRIPEDQVKDNPFWGKFNTQLIDDMQGVVKELALVPTTGGQRPVSLTAFPNPKVTETLMDGVVFQNFCNLVQSTWPIVKIEKFEVKEGKVQRTSDSIAWTSTIDQISSIFPEDTNLVSITSLRDKLTGFCDSKYPKFADLTKEFNCRDGKEFLENFYTVLDYLFNQGAITADYAKGLVPDQEEAIGSIAGTYDSGKSFALSFELKDDPIPGDLKDILTKIGWNIRDELVHSDFSGFNIIKEHVRNTKTVTEVLDTAVSHKDLVPQAKVSDVKDTKAEGWIELFRWCATRRRVPSGFPLISKDGTVRVVVDSSDEVLLVTFEVMGISSNLESVFPDARIIHSSYFALEDEKKRAFMDSLLDYKALVTKIPVQRGVVSLSSEKLLNITGVQLKSPGTEHELKVEANAAGTITQLPFWGEVIGKISNRSERGKLLFEFILDLAKSDSSWRQQLDVRCSCEEGSHKIIPSAWLGSIKTDSWVPISVSKEGESTMVSAHTSRENILNLYKDDMDSFNRLIAANEDVAGSLLSHLGFDTLDINVRLHSIKTGEDEKSLKERVSDIVGVVDLVDPKKVKELLTKNPQAIRDAFFSAEQKEKDNVAREENKIIGVNIQRIMGRIIHDHGLAVVSIYEGGDLEVWPDQTAGCDFGEVTIGRVVVEVKSTTGTRVHLSRRQSELSGEMKENHVVLVVDDTGNLRELLKEPVDPDNVSEEMIEDLVQRSHVIENLYTKFGSLPDPEELEADISGYWIKARLWAAVDNVDTWVQKRFGVGQHRSQP